MESTTEKTILVDLDFNVVKRLQQLREWEQEWKIEDSLLLQRINQLDGSNRLHAQLGAQISSFRKRKRMHLVRRPLSISPDSLEQVGFENLRKHMTEQFVELSKEQRLLWLNNFLYIRHYID